jgi:DNA-binding MarR family transcriptional regulator
MKTKEPTDSFAQQQRVQQFTQYLLLLRKMQDKQSATFLKSLGNLSMQELNVLNAIGDFDACIMSDIAKQTSLSLSSITVIVDKLVRAKLAKRIRKEDDRRVVYGALTAEGRKIYQLQIEHVHEVINKLFTALTTEEQESLLKIFLKFTRALM